MGQYINRKTHDLGIPAFAPTISILVDIISHSADCSRAV